MSKSVYTDSCCAGVLTACKKPLCVVVRREHVLNLSDYDQVSIRDLSHKFLKS